MIYETSHRTPGQMSTLLQWIVDDGLGVGITAKMMSTSLLLLCHTLDGKSQLTASIMYHWPTSYSNIQNLG